MYFVVLDWLQTHLPCLGGQSTIQAKGSYGDDMCSANVITALLETFGI
jgi:hypothetical protein